MLVRYTNRSWLRIYPLGTEIASSNYNPIHPLTVGAQIIALNTQTKDDYAWLMMSYFTAGRPIVPGKIGYVLKPHHLRTNIPHNIHKLINIKIISSIEKVSIKFYGTE
jgi:phosphatidylinositol phospholipase C delta